MEGKKEFGCNHLSKYSSEAICESLKIEYEKVVQMFSEEKTKFG